MGLRLLLKRGRVVERTLLKVRVIVELYLPLGLGRLPGRLLSVVGRSARCPIVRVEPFSIA